VDAASVSETMDAASSDEGRPFAASGLDKGVDFGFAGSAASAMGSSLGVGIGVTSVEGVTSTSSASRYHFLRRV
jgi:hypothetical protein